MTFSLTLTKFYFFNNGLLKIGWLFCFIVFINDFENILFSQKKQNNYFVKTFILFSIALIFLHFNFNIEKNKIENKIIFQQWEKEVEEKAIRPVVILNNPNPPQIPPNRPRINTF